MLKVKNTAELQAMKVGRPVVQAFPTALAAPAAPALPAPAADPAALAQLQQALALVAQGVAAIPALIAAQRPEPHPRKMDAQMIRDRKGRLERIEITVIS